MDKKIKFIVTYLMKKVQIYRNKTDYEIYPPRQYTQLDHSQMTKDYIRLISVCKNTEKEFNYIQ